MQLPDVGTLFENRYRIDAVLGEGGFARVYEATSDGVQRKVAIKVLKPHDSTGYDPTMVARFLQEARVMSQLRDPHTITMYDCGRSEDGLLFMVCELLPGEDLSDLLLRRGKLTEAEVVTVVRQILQSLREAHELGLLHRDIKPGNIRIFEYMGEPLTVKVLDFGIAKSSDLQSQLTATGRVIGTPRYMSPEQLRGQELTPASDIYSVGLVAHELLLGSRERTELVSRVVIKPADLVSRGVRDVVNRMLEPDPTHRFTTAEAVLEALDALDAVSSTVVPTPRPEAAPEAPPTVRDMPRRPTTVVEEPWPRTTVEGAQSPEAPNVRAWATGAIFVFVLFAAAGGMYFFKKINTDMAQRAAYTKGAHRLEQWHQDIDPRAPVTTSPEQTAHRAPTHEPEYADEPTKAEAPPVEDPCAVDFVGGVGTKRFYDGLDRIGVTAYVPNSYDPAVPKPLILAWGDQSERRVMLADEGMQSLADSLGAVVATVSLEDLKLTKGTPQERQRRVIAEVKNAIYATKKGFCIDDSKVFAIGTEHDAKRLVEYRCGLPIAAIVTTGANVRPQACEPTPEVPHLHIHAEQDLTTPRKKEPKRNLTCTDNFTNTYAEMATVMDEVYGCVDAEVVEIADGCELRECQRAPVAMCTIDSGRIWQKNVVSRCKGARPSEPTYAAMIASFLQSIAAQP